MSKYIAWEDFEDTIEVLLECCAFPHRSSEKIKNEVKKYYLNSITTIEISDSRKWIPVSERLPSESGWYLVTVQGYETVTDVTLYSADGYSWSDVSAKQRVIAWMPLPEPYKEGDT